MTPRSPLQLGIQVARLILLPIPAAIFLSMAALQITFHLLYPDHSYLPSGEPGEEIGRFLLILFTAILQGIVGIPTLLALDATSSGLRRYSAAGAIVALTLSLAFAAILQGPEFGETLGWTFPRVLLFLGIPLFACYLFAFYLRSPHGMGSLKAVSCVLGR